MVTYLLDIVTQGREIEALGYFAVLYQVYKPITTGAIYTWR